MLKPALAYVERLGFAVFGVAANCRTPLVVEGEYEHGYKDATADPEEVRRRWSRHPDANIAVATGERSGVFVLDIDRKGEVDGFGTLARLEAKFSPLPPTWRSRTPSGGEHRWFRFVPEATVLRNWAPLAIWQPDGAKRPCLGLDIRTTGGSVAVPPSRKSTGVYEWIDRPSDLSLADPPEWLLTAFLPPPTPPKSFRPLHLYSSDRAARYVAAVVNDECGDLAQMGQGGRNLRLFQAAANLGALVGANLLQERVAVDALERAASDCGLLHEDGPGPVRATIQSGLKRGIAQPREVRL